MAARSIRAFGPSNFSTELRASGGTAVRSCVCGIPRRGPIRSAKGRPSCIFSTRTDVPASSPVRNPQGEITPSLGLDWVFIPKKKKRRSCVGPAQYPSMSLPRDQGEVARGLAQMKVVLNSANHSEGVQRGTTCPKTSLTCSTSDGVLRCAINTKIALDIRCGSQHPIAHGRFRPAHDPPVRSSHGRSHTFRRDQAGQVARQRAAANPGRQRTGKRS